MHAILFILLDILALYRWVVIAYVIMTWLLQFGVINRYNQVTQQVMRFLEALTEPALSRIRKVIPAVGGFDLSAVVLLLIVLFLELLLRDDIAPAVLYGSWG